MKMVVNNLECGHLVLVDGLKWGLHDFPSVANCFVRFYNYSEHNILSTPSQFFTQQWILTVTYLHQSSRMIITPTHSTGRIRSELEHTHGSIILDK
jgi:hypothetical protein